MRYFLDTEFYEHDTSIDLISIGVVAEDGRELYLESSDFDWETVPKDHWIQQNVRPFLTGESASRNDIAYSLYKFTHPSPQFWAWYGDYDWVVTCQLFGRMVDLPTGWPMLCLDIKQLALHVGVSNLPAQQGTKHNALEDARWNKQAYEYLVDYTYDLERVKSGYS